MLPTDLGFDCKQAPTPRVETKRTQSRVCNTPSRSPNHLAPSSRPVALCAGLVPPFHHHHTRRSQGLATTRAAAGWAEQAGFVLAPLG